MLLLLCLLGAVTADYSVRMPYLNPAGVTYTSHAAAYGPLAYKSYAGPLIGGPLLASPLAGAHVGHLATAPLAAAPYAALPVAPAVSVAPASAVVPVTRISAQPAVLQNVVDVAHPKVATRRYQIRRPAIEKQFYDIEEKIVVRPAGSAVVELEQPISANQRGPTQVSPAVHVAQPLLRYAHKIHFGTPFLPAYLQSVPSPVHESSSLYEESYQQEESPSQGPSTPAPPQQLLPSQPSLPPQPFPNQPLQPQPLPPQNAFPQSPEQPQLDTSDSVAIDNPELARSGEQQPQQPTVNLQQPLFRSQLQRAPQPQPEPQLPRSDQSQIQSLQQIPQQPQPQLQRGAIDQEFQQFLAQLEQTSPQVFGNSQIEQNQQHRELQESQLQLLEREIFGQNPQQAQERSQQVQPQAQIFIGSQQEQAQPQLLFRSQLQPQLLGRTQLLEVPQAQPLNRPEPVEQSSLRTPQRSELSANLQLPEIASVRNLSPEQQELNQRRLIELLTGQGPVSEVGGPVRARVISATPAPPQAPPADSRSSTRRVVVNRPIQTVQEVEVVQPFTKLERVAVHQPAVLKTSNVELAHVPAVTPVVHAAAVTPVPLAAHYL